MTVAAEASILSAAGRTPELHETAFVAAGARIVGGVTLEAGASVWYNAVLRADGDSITLGANSNVQDNVSVHAAPNAPGVASGVVFHGHAPLNHVTRCQPFSSAMRWNVESS